MAIGTGDGIDKFGTQDTVTAAGGTAAVGNTGFSAASDVVSGGWVNADDAPMAGFVLTFQYPSGTIVSDGIILYMRLMDVDGTNDEPQPDTNYKKHPIGKFTPDTAMAALTDNSITLGHDVPLPNMKSSQVYEFYIENQIDVTISAGWTLKIVPKSIGPHA